jgi:hypothetical protein
MFEMMTLMGPRHRHPVYNNDGDVKGERGRGRQVVLN